MLLRTIFSTLFTTLLFLPVAAAVDSTFHCYLLFGQSNMAGGGAGVPLGGSSGTLNAADCDTSSRIKVLAFCNCNTGEMTACANKPSPRTEGNWYTASIPLHICGEGVSPGDWFAKTMLDSIRDDIKIGLIPCALSGMGLQVFTKGGSNYDIPNWAHPTLANSSPYAWMLARCKIAQQTGVIKGILLHQGESGSGNQQWDKLATQISNDLKSDLGLPNNLPVIVGELRQDAKACCSGANTAINAFAKSYPNGGLASSLNVGVQSDDPYHFNPEGMREMGKRYAQSFLALASQSYLPRKGTVAVITPRSAKTVTPETVKDWRGDSKIFTLTGRHVPVQSKSNPGDALHNVRPGGIYLVSRGTCSGLKLMVMP